MVANTNKNQQILTMATISIVIILVATASYFTTRQTDAGKVKVVATFYPLAFFAREIGGEHVSVIQLIPDNTEVHHWDPRTESIQATEDADIIIYNGAGLDNWMETSIIPALKDISQKIIVNTTEGIALRETDHDANNDHDHDEAHDQYDHDENDHIHGLHDPHTWISPFIAKQQAQKIYEAMIQKDPDNATYYAERWESLQSTLNELDEAYMEGLSNKTKTSIFVTHAAFGYLADRYNFSQHGVYGLSADKQPSPSEIADLVDMMVEHETYVIYVDPIYREKYADTLKTELEERTGNSVQILRLYLMLGTVDGLDYFDQQEANLENLKIGLGA